MSTTQVAVRLDDELLERLDWLVSQCDVDTRADVIRTALAEMAKRKRDEEIDARIREAYARMPETDEHRAAPNWTAIDGLDDEDWSKWR